MNKKLKRLWLVGGFFFLVMIIVSLKVNGFFSVTQKVGCTPPEAVAYELRGEYMAGVCASEQPKEVNGFALYRAYANYFAFDESAPYESGKNPFGITQEVYNSGSLAVESWTCGEYGACSNGVQSRVCTDAGNTGRMLHKPVVSQGCIVQEQPVVAAPVVSEPVPVVVAPSVPVLINQQVPEKNKVLVWGASLFILLLLLYAYMKWFK